MDPSLVGCDFFGRIWCLVSNWLGFDTMTHGTLLDHIVHFCGLGGFLKQVRLSMNIIWLSTAFVI